MWVFYVFIGWVLMLYSGSDWTQGFGVSWAESAWGVA
jgi:hypothetical protein